jgi:hypothetical protein
VGFGGLTRKDRDQGSESNGKDKSGGVPPHSEEGDAELGVRGRCQTQVSGAWGSVVRSQTQVRRVAGRVGSRVRLVVCSIGGSLALETKLERGRFRETRAGAGSHGAAWRDARGLKAGSGRREAGAREGRRSHTLESQGWVL